MVQNVELHPLIRDSLNPAQSGITDKELVERSLSVRRSSSWVPGVGNVNGIDLLLCDIVGDLGYLPQEEVANLIHESSALPHGGDTLVENMYRGARDIKGVRLVSAAQAYAQKHPEIAERAHRELHGDSILLGLVIAGLNEARFTRYNGGPSVRHSTAVAMNLEIADQVIARQSGAVRPPAHLLAAAVIGATLHDVVEHSSPKNGASPYSITITERRLTMNTLDISESLQVSGMQDSEARDIAWCVRDISQRTGVTGLMPEGTYMLNNKKHLVTVLDKLSDGTHNNKQDSKKVKEDDPEKRDKKEKEIVQRSVLYNEREVELLNVVRTEYPVLLPFAIAVTGVTRGDQHVFKSKKNSLLAMVRPRKLDEWASRQSTDFIH